ncbi:hypothetical protein B0G69_1329 [Paraburkholderia sp. RAU2J]|uniref:hypothetical protein n=1 Tax=Paraburkholderia sp. RAU2J TaxID=1938810 RepID=UPI000EACBCF5|nr:hypothetical protein [Paraburkholderia sp. RAU2J]RKT25611.1 hypothetical protein B0G69_1329 [Paraburkholderia sp. RAU2J]
MKPATRVVALAVTSLLLSGCEDDWGDKIANFVDNEVHALTVEIARQELELRWLDYFRGLPIKSALVLGVTGKLIDTEDISKSEVASFDNREELLTRINLTDLNTIAATKMLRSAIAEIDRVDTLCEDTNALYTVDMAGIGQKISQQIALPEPQWYVEISCQFGGGENQGAASANGGDRGDSGGNCWKSLVSVVTAIFGADSQKEQEEKAKNAISRIPQRVVSPAEVLSMSRMTCAQVSSLPLIRQSLEKSRIALSSALQASSATAVALSNMRTRLNAQQIPALLAEVTDATGVQKTASAVASEYESVAVEATISRQRKDLQYFESRALNAASCGEVLGANQLYALVLAEKRTQLQAAVGVGSTYGPDFQALLDSVTAAEKTFSEMHGARAARLCASH